MEPPSKRRRVTTHFTVNGSLSSKSDSVIRLDISDWNQQLIDKIEAKEYLILQGPRASGKSTRVNYLIDTLEERYTCPYTSLQRVLVDSKTDFWQSLSSALHPWLEADFKNRNEFSTVLEKPRDKPVVLFLDEFDNLLQNQEVLEDFLSIIRHLRQFPTKHSLQSVVLIGPFSLMSIVTLKLSPFSITDAYANPLWTLDQTKTLFSLLKQSRPTWQCETDPIAGDVFNRTAGHAGLTVYLAKKFDEEFMCNKLNCTLDDWIKFVTLKLIPNLSYGWSVLQTMVVRLLSKDQEWPNAVTWLKSSFLLLPSLSEYKAVPSNYLSIARMLVSEGILRIDPNDNTRFAFLSPITRSVVLSALASTAITPLALTNTADIPKIISELLPHFNSSNFRPSPLASYKKNKAPGTDRTTLVPSEATYHFELFSLLVRSLSTFMVTVQNEVNCGPAGNLFCDILVKYPTDRTVVLELVAHAATRGEAAGVLEHMNKTEGYAKTLGADEAWVINFTLSENQVKLLAAEKLPPRVNVLHVVHDLNWTEAGLWVGDKSCCKIALQK